MCAKLTKHKSKIKPKAIILLSGGLDSTIAARLIQQQDISLVALNFTSPFCLCNKKGGCSHGIRAVAQSLGIPSETIDNSNEMLECLKKPKFGFGSNMNPCIDCRIIMLKKAKKYMRKAGACFVITGEVLGQRPMSQRLQTLRLIEKEAGLEGLILRPLSAQSLTETLPEKKGWIDRGKLLNIVGRGRREQIEIAERLGIDDYPCPAGGCLLTDPNFSRRLRDLMKYNPGFNLNDILLLKLGRHFRIDEDCKLIVGRNEKENNSLVSLSAKSDLIFMPEETIAGPTAIGRGRFSDKNKELASGLLSRYCDRDVQEKVKILIKMRGVVKKGCLDSRPVGEEVLSRLII